MSDGTNAIFELAKIIDGKTYLPQENVRYAFKTLESKLSQSVEREREAVQIIEGIIEQECGNGKDHHSNIKINNKWYCCAGLSCYEWAFSFLKQITEQKESE